MNPTILQSLGFLALSLLGIGVFFFLGLLFVRWIDDGPGDIGGTR